MSTGSLIDGPPPGSKTDGEDSLLGSLSAVIPLRFVLKHTHSN